MPDAEPGPTRTPRLRAVGRAFGDRNYRLFLAGQGVSLVGTWVSRLAGGRLAVRLGGPAAAWLLGAVGFAALAPAFFLGPVAGVFVDRWDRHAVLLVTQVLSLLQSAALAAVAVAAGPGAETVWLVAGLGAAQGGVNAFDMPARQSLLVEMAARREDLPNAFAMNSSLVNGSRLVGPAAGAVIAAAGEAWCFALDAASDLAVAAALLAMRLPKKERARAAGSVGRQFAEGVRYAAGFPPVRALLRLLAPVSFAATPQAVLLPVFAADVLGGGPHTPGLLSAASGAGALAGALDLASRSSVLGLGRVTAAATAVLGVGPAGFSQSASAGLSAALLALAGFGTMVQMAAADTLIQTVVDDDKRGRVMGLFGTAFQGRPRSAACWRGRPRGPSGSGPWSWGRAWRC